MCVELEGICIRVLQRSSADMICVCVYLYGLDVYIFFLSSVIGLQGEIEMD